ncbi:unnamed protein product [Oncorhynchus mykiss]|uniref:Uncharacterized protein n=1 Tax=Oncorhynchus mykiss TaxID=8022 RepID=A0A060YW54_ONCMY|nr:unnamed protein product [Oncorhynchus mykiss]
MHENTNCSGRLCDHAIRSRCKTFKQVNIHKAAGPDRLPGHVLCACADQLASVLTDIFILSLSESVIPTCFKQTTIVPVPKNTKIHRLCNLYCTPQCPFPLGQKDHLCENAIH